MNDSYRSLWARLKSDHDLLEQEVAKAVELDPNHLLSAMYAQPSLIMTWSYMASFASAEAESAKFHLNDIVVPELRAQARLSSLPKKITVQEAEDFAAQHPKYLEAKTKYLDAQALADTLRKVEFALGHKRDMIQTINSRQRMDLRVSE